MEVVDSVPDGHNKVAQIKHWTRAMFDELRGTVADRGLAGVDGSLPKLPGSKLLKGMPSLQGLGGVSLKDFDIQKMRETIEQRNRILKEAGALSDPDHGGSQPEDDPDDPLSGM